MHQRHVLYDDLDEENDAESLPLDPMLQITPEVNWKNKFAGIKNVYL